MLGMGVAGTFTGKFPGRYGEVSYRVRDPKQYWLAFAIYYFAGIYFIGYYVYEKYGF